MTEKLISFTPAELTFIGAYVLSLVLIGWLGYRARREDSLRDFYLAGNGIGFVVLLLTLYATQYSGNTLFGFTGKTCRVGYSWTVSIHFMTAIVVFYLLLAPKLYGLAKKHGFITPVDFLQHRFNSPALSLLATVVMVVAISNFLLAQLMAMGRALEGLTSGYEVQAYTCGVVALGLVIVVYETLGGFRAVVWTDVIQGLVLLAGFAILLVLVFQHYGTLEGATRKLIEDEQQAISLSPQPNASPPAPSKIQPPDASGCREWLSYILLVGIGGALYPQVIQRIYAARSAATLRRSLSIMAFMPLATALIALVVGVIGAAYVDGLITYHVDQAGQLVKTDHSDKLLAVICREIQGSSMLGRWLVVVLYSAILAAIMSTADSVLLSISSMLTKDVYARFVNPRASDARLTKLGKVCSWFLIALLVVLAIKLRGTTLVTLLDRKFDMLVQLAPAFFLGVHWKKMHPAATLAGIVAGLAVALGLAAAGYSRLLGIHPGLYGLALNLLIAIVGSLLAGDSPDDSRNRAS